MLCLMAVFYSEMALLYPPVAGVLLLQADPEEPAADAL